MLRLGGDVLTLAEEEASSFAKGETLEDAVRVVSSYADVIVLRHPEAGAAERALAASDVPLINAGDGGREHPSQALLDLLTLKCECGRLEDLTVLLYGDLLHSRTIHSLAPLLLRLGALLILLPEPGRDLPHAMIGAEEELAVGACEVRGLAPLGSVAESIRAIGPLSRLPAGGRVLELDSGTVDAIYATRLQDERKSGSRSRELTLPVIDESFLDVPALRRAVVLHPLPRRGEVSRSIDQDPRAAYFRQAALGVPLRMALLLRALH